MKTIAVLTHDARNNLDEPLGSQVGEALDILERLLLNLGIGVGGVPERVQDAPSKLAALQKERLDAIMRVQKVTEQRDEWRRVALALAMSTEPRAVVVDGEPPVRPGVDYAAAYQRVLDRLQKIARPNSDHDNSEECLLSTASFQVREYRRLHELHDALCTAVGIDDQTDPAELLPRVQVLAALRGAVADLREAIGSNDEATDAQVIYAAIAMLGTPEDRATHAHALREAEADLKACWVACTGVVPTAAEGWEHEPGGVAPRVREMRKVADKAQRLFRLLDDVAKEVGLADDADAFTDLIPAIRRLKVLGSISVEACSEIDKAKLYLSRAATKLGDIPF